MLQTSNLERESVVVVVCVEDDNLSRTTNRGHGFVCWLSSNTKSPSELEYLSLVGEISFAFGDRQLHSIKELQKYPVQMMTVVSRVFVSLVWLLVSLPLAEKNVSGLVSRRHLLHRRPRWDRCSFDVKAFPNMWSVLGDHDTFVPNSISANHANHRLSRGLV